MKPTIDATEFEELYRATARDVFAYVRRRVLGDAEEIVAETYAVAWRRRADLPSEELRRAWLFGVARTLVLAHGRRQRRQVELVQSLSTAPPAAESASKQRPGAPEVMAAALERLSPSQAELLRLVGWEGLTPAELAVVLGVRPGTARVQLHRARQALAADPEVREFIEGRSRRLVLDQAICTASPKC